MLATLGLLAWKLKTLLRWLLTKGKLLMLGLTNAGTVLSMFLSIGVYWAAFGWPFAVGLMLSLYVHEMGHVAALRRLGIPASLPMFLPGLGAVVRLRQPPATRSEDARIGAGGPALGDRRRDRRLRSSIWAAAGRSPPPSRARGAWVNLFNLLPVWQLDGGRAFHALSRPQRIAAALVMGALWLWTREGLLILLLAVAAFRAFRPGAARRGRPQGDPPVRPAARRARGALHDQGAPRSRAVTSLPRRPAPAPFVGGLQTTIGQRPRIGVTQPRQLPPSAGGLPHR